MAAAMLAHGEEPASEPTCKKAAAAASTAAAAQHAAMQRRADGIAVPRLPPPAETRVEVPGLGIGTYVGPAPRLLKSDQHLVEFDLLRPGGRPLRLTPGRAAAGDASWLLVRGSVTVATLTGERHKIPLSPGMTAARRAAQWFAVCRRDGGQGPAAGGRGVRRGGPARLRPRARCSEHTGWSAWAASRPSG